MSSYAANRSGKEGALGEGAFVKPKRVCPGWSEIKTVQVTGYASRRRPGGGLHGIQATAASRVLLLLDDVGWARTCWLPARRHPCSRLLSLPAWRGYARGDGGWRGRRYWRRGTTRHRRRQRQCMCCRPPRRAGLEQLATPPRAGLERRVAPSSLEVEQ
jgi:hypothetical protein